MAYGGAGRDIPLRGSPGPGGLGIKGGPIQADPRLG